MRLFLAVELPAALRGELVRSLAPLKVRLPKARWVPPDNLHLTLVFLGEVGEERQDGLRPALATACSEIAPFAARLGAAGIFPARPPARVAWLGVEAAVATGGPEGTRPDGLAELQRRAAAAAREALGSPLEERPFHAHLTVARPSPPWRRDAIETWLGDWTRGASGALSEPFEVLAATLFSSRLGSGGPRHEALATFPLGQPAAAAGLDATDGRRAAQRDPEGG